MRGGGPKDWMTPEYLGKIEEERHVIATRLTASFDLCESLLEFVKAEKKMDFGKTLADLLERTETEASRKRREVEEKLESLRELSEDFRSYITGQATCSDIATDE